VTTKQTDGGECRHHSDSLSSPSLFFKPLSLSLYYLLFISFSKTPTNYYTTRKKT